jgi:hypothetical protein
MPFKKIILIKFLITNDENRVGKKIAMAARGAIF